MWILFFRRMYVGMSDQSPFFLIDKCFSLLICCIAIFKDFLKFIFREREREGGRVGNMNVREKHGSAAACAPPPRTELATPACARTGNGTRDLLLCRTMPSVLIFADQGPFDCVSEVNVFGMTPQSGWGGDWTYLREGVNQIFLNVLQFQLKKNTCKF